MSNYTLLQSPPDPTAVTVASDLEGTLSAGQAWRGMQDYLVNHNYKNLFRGFFVRKLPHFLLFRMGLADGQAFKEAWILGILKLFEGFSRDEFAAVTNWVIEKEVWPQRRQSVLDELHEHQANGRRVIIVTGMFEPFVDAFAQKAGGLEAIATPLRYEDDYFTGETAVPFNVGSRKVDVLRPFMNNGQIYAAYGDTAADVPMLEISQNPVAIWPDEGLRATAVAHNWRILDT